MSALMIFLIILALLYFLGPHIRRWLLRWGQRRMQDYVFRKMGVSPEMRERYSRQSHERGDSTRNSRRRRGGSEPIIPREYAEDVEFTEISTMETSGAEQRQTVHFKAEKQVTDVEWVELPDNDRHA